MFDKGCHMVRYRRLSLYSETLSSEREEEVNPPPPHLNQGCVSEALGASMAYLLGLSKGSIGCKMLRNSYQFGNLIITKFLLL